ncbi:MAG: TetR/AcrR family transcriptional regulator [Chitinophagaceae bacterium]
MLEQKDRIKEQARVLFVKYGIRSVSMDDIASSLGMSKKTIYNFFADKDELVLDIIDSEIEKMKTDCVYSVTESENAIQEIFMTMDRIQTHQKQMNPTVVYDLQKFHHKAFSKFMTYKNSFLLEVIRQNMIRGIKEQLYRDDVNIEMMARYRLETVMVPFNTDLYPQEQFDLTEVTLAIQEHFIYGLATQKGFSLIEKYKQERIKTLKQ